MMMTEGDLIEAGGLLGSLVPDELARLRRLGYIEVVGEDRDEPVYRLTKKGRAETTPTDVRVLS